MHQSTSEQPTALILGCGYLGTRVARRLRDAGCTVTATRRSEEGCAELREAGVEAVPFDFADAATSPLLERRFDQVVCCAAPGRTGNAEAVFLEGPLGAARRLRNTRFVYVSSTGVYAQQDGAELDEESPAEPTEARPALLRNAERKLLEMTNNSAAQALVIRLGGLYGPGRSPLSWLEREGMRSRLAARGRNAYMNWIHIDDAAAVVTLAALRGRPGEIYLGVDGSPVRRGDFFDLAARSGGQPPLEFIDPAGPPDLGKRLSRAKATRELDFAPEYPSYREGLASLIDD